MNTKITDNLEATILEIQRMSTEDGPGIRTTVFLKGCSLKCSWCHNPESINRQPELHWVGNRCIGCRSCQEICPSRALILDDVGMKINRDSCEGCGTCAGECPSTALELMGETWGLNDLVTEVSKDKVYFDKSGGGVTLSGGEPGLQPQFSAAFLKAMKERGIQTAFDTCGFCSELSLEMILPCTTLVLFDLKLMDPEKHCLFTGRSNDRILDNLLFTARFIRSHIHPKAMWIRTPIIPGTTDSEENIRAIGSFISGHIAPVVERWELCAFNNLCQDKYQRLDRQWDFESTQLVLQDEMDHLAAVARHSGVNPDIVHGTGATRLAAETASASVSAPPLRAVINGSPDLNSATEKGIK